MVSLPEPATPTVTAIFEAYESRAAESRRRGHLGGSEVGRPCARELWYRFRWALRPSFDGRMLRLFDTGHREEPRILDDLRSVGVEVTERNEATGKQWRFSALGGHFSGSMDAAARGLLEAPKTWHLVEIKTANARRFKELKRLGVERAKPEHFAQMQVYMMLSGLTRAAYFAVCKDTDAIHYERVYFERSVAQTLIERAEQVIKSPAPLTKFSADPFSPPCGFCDFLRICHEEEVPDVNCRTCAHSTPVVDGGEEGRWVCDKLGHDLSHEDQEAGCDEHLFIPPLVPYADAVDVGDGYVLYQIRKKEQRFVNCAATSFPATDVPHFSSHALKVVSPDAIGNEVVEKARELFGELGGGGHLFEMRAPCKACGETWGEVRRKSGQDTVWCRCGTYQYNAPRRETEAP